MDPRKNGDKYMILDNFSSYNYNLWIASKGVSFVKLGNNNSFKAVNDNSLDKNQSPDQKLGS